MKSEFSWGLVRTMEVTDLKFILCRYHGGVLMRIHAVLLQSILKSQGMKQI